MGKEFLSPHPVCFTGEENVADNVVFWLAQEKKIDWGQKVENLFKEQWGRSDLLQEFPLSVGKKIFLNTLFLLSFIPYSLELKT